MENNAIIVKCIYPINGRQLKRLIIAILKKKLAKCIQRVNYVKSYYIWENELKKTEEKILLIKTTQEKEKELYAFIHKMHPYDTPEIMTINPQTVDPKYLERLSTAN